MDPSLANPSTLDYVVPLLTGGVLTAVAGLTGAGVGVTVNALRRRTLWQRVGERLGLRQQTGPVSLLATPALSGIYRGRAVEASLLASGQTRIVVRVANPRRLFDQIRADDAPALSGALWLGANQRREIGALRDRLRRPGSIGVGGNFVTLIAPGAGGKDPQTLQTLLALAHDVAQSVDSASGAFVASPLRGRRRCGPRALTGRRRVV